MMASLVCLCLSPYFLFPYPRWAFLARIAHHHSKSQVLFEARFTQRLSRRISISLVLGFSTSRVAESLF